MIWRGKGAIATAFGGLQNARVTVATALRPMGACFVGATLLDPARWDL